MESNANATGKGVPEAQLIIDLTQTDLPLGTPVYVYIIGLVVSESSTDTFYYIDNNGDPQIMDTSNNTILANTFPGMDKLDKKAKDIIALGYPLAWADYSIPVEVGSNLILNLGNINTSTIPTLGTGTAAFSGRVYISVGVPKLPFTVTDNGYTAPVYGDGSGITGSFTLYDWIEFSYDSEGNFNGNTTQVNQFGFPLTLTGTPVGGSPYPSQGALNKGQTTILSNISAKSEPFGGKGVVVRVPADAASAYPDNVDYLRAISPVSASGAPANSYYDTLNDYFDADIATAYTAWQSTPLVTYDSSTKYYTGVVFPVSGATIPVPEGYPEGSLAFYEGNYATMQDLAKAIASDNPPIFGFYLTGSKNTITSNDIWQCAGSLATGGDAQKNVGKMIGAAFNRGIVVSKSGTVITSLDDSTCSKLADTFYSEGTKYNEWAKWFHEYNTNGLAYGFPYDDVCDQNPSIPPSGKTLVASFIRIALGNFFS